MLSSSITSPSSATAIETIAPTAGDGATHRHSRAWAVAVVALGVVNGLLTSGCTAQKEPERLSVATAADKDTDKKGGTAPQDPLPPDALFAKASPAVVQVVIQDRQ